jgi:hypothetical protein
LKFVREQFFLAAAAQNLKRLVRFLSQPTRPVLGSYRLKELLREEKLSGLCPMKSGFCCDSFSTPTPDFIS